MFTKTIAQTKAIDLLGGPQKWTLLYGGSRSGKTFIIIYALIARASIAPDTRHVIFRYRFNHAKASVFQDTLPKVLRLCFPHLKVKVDHTDYTVTLPNGSSIVVAGLDDKERTEKILGQEFSTIYLNEASQIPYVSAQMSLTRLAQKSALKNKMYVDANPPTKSHWLYRLFVQHIDPITKSKIPNPDDFMCMRINPDDNAINVSDDYITSTLAGLTDRAKRRFLYGEWLDDAEGALWNRDMINAARVTTAPPQLMRIVVGCDPAVTAKEGSDSTGIVVAGMDRRGHYYILADRTMDKATPNAWGNAVVNAYEEYQADTVVAEVNQGGDLVEMNIKRTNSNLRYKSVHSTRGKILRAEPIAGLYEQGRVHHVGEYPELEDQMCSYAPQVQDEMDSPDRLDALVFALTELSGMNASSVRAIGRSINH